MPLPSFVPLLFVLSSGAGALQPAPTPRIVFVCEHGAAKSLIAAAYFNKLAAGRGLPARATFRGVDPQDDLSVRAVAGLKRDGVAIPAGRPARLSAHDIREATHVFAIGCALPRAAGESGKATSWDDVPDDKGYEGMRDAIVRHLDALLDELAAGRESAGPAGRVRYDSCSPSRPSGMFIGHDANPHR